MWKEIFIVFSCVLFFFAVHILPKFKDEKIQIPVQQKPRETRRIIPDRYALLPLSKNDPLAKQHFSDVLSHPWIQAQEDLMHIVPEMIRDLETLKIFSEEFQQKTTLSEEAITATLIDTLSNLQKNIPFITPIPLYSVLCFSDPISQLIPFSSKLCKRMYLGENALGFPYYLDIRVFNDRDKSEEIIRWFQQLIDGTEEIVLGNMHVFRGKRRDSYPDTSHGFTEINEERGLYLHFNVDGSTLFLAVFEASWDKFSEFLPILKRISVK